MGESPQIYGYQNFCKEASISDTDTKRQTETETFAPGGKYILSRQREEFRYIILRHKLEHKQRDTGKVSFQVFLKQCTSLNTKVCLLFNHPLTQMSVLFAQEAQTMQKCEKMSGPTIVTISFLLSKSDASCLWISTV